jgi:hypothetical protein
MKLHNIHNNFCYSVSSLELLDKFSIQGSTEKLIIIIIL